MRTIKFRGLRVDGVGFAYGVPVSDGERTYIVSGVVDCNKDFITIEQWQTVLPWTIGQFTGVTDKNGMEVFEGDLIDWNGSGFMLIVEWQGACFVLSGPDYPKPMRGKTIQGTVKTNIHEQ